jgi:hypothetical protein
MYSITRLHAFSLSTLIASASLALGCAKILGDFDLSSASAGGSASAYGSTVASGGIGGAFSSSGTDGALSSSGTDGTQASSGSSTAVSSGSSTTVSSGSSTTASSGSSTTVSSGSSTVATSSSTSGTGGSTGTGGCAPGGTVEMHDDFNDNVIGSSWATFEDGSNNEVVVSESNQAAHIRSNGASFLYGGYYWAGTPRSLIGCQAFIEVKQVPSKTIPLLAYFQLNGTGAGQGHWLNIDVYKGNIDFNHSINGVVQGTEISIPYDPIAHRWWRFREASGKIFLETSPDGKTSWQSHFSISTPSFVSAVYVEFGMGAEGSASPGGEAIFDNLSVPPP